MTVEAPISDMSQRKAALLRIWELQDELNPQEDVSAFDPQRHIDIQDFERAKKAKISDLSFRMNALRGYFPDEYKDIQRVLLIEKEDIVIRETTDVSSSFAVKTALRRLDVLESERATIGSQYTPTGNKSQLELIFTTGLKYARDIDVLQQ